MYDIRLRQNIFKMADNDLELLELGDSTGADSRREQNGSSRHRSRSPVRKSRSRSRSPREWRRGERNRSRDRDRERRRSVREGPGGKVRLYVCNMPYDVRWQDLKDFFKKELGQCVTFVELYDNPDGRPSGAGVVEIKGKENAEKAIDKMDRAELKGRKIIVREEREKDRMRHGNMSGGGGGGGMGRDMDGDMGMRGGGMNMGGGGMNMGGGMGMGGSSNSAGISPQVMQQLNLDPNNITNQVFIANLDYKVTGRKLREIFKMAGTVVDVDLKEDKEGKSRGMCVIRFEHPIEAVQAISMFNGQVLYERTMTVKMDRMGESTYSPQQIPNKLPSGLQGIGMGLGSGGAPVSAGQIKSSSMNMGGMGGGMLGASSGMMGGMSNMGSSMGNMNNGMGMSNTGMGMSGGMSTGMGTGMGSMGMSGMNTMSSMNTMGSGLGSGMGGMGGQMGGMSSGMGLGGMGGDMSMGSTGMGSGMSSMGDLGMGGMGGGMGGMSGGMGSSMGNYGGSGGLSNRGGSVGGRGSDSQDNTTVFVRNLPFSFTWQELKQKFNNCGEVKYAEIKMDGSRSKGFGTVKFLTSDDARRAVNLMNGARIEGRQIEVRLNRV